MTIRCPNCKTLYRVESERVPQNYSRARCGRCAEVFPIARDTDDRRSTAAEKIVTAMVSTPPPAEEMVPAYAGEISPTPGEAAVRQPEPVHATVPPAPASPDLSVAPDLPATPTLPEATPGAGVHFFGPQDPDQRARHLARALVSDIVAYYPERIERSRAAGTLRDDFREEILKSWEEFVLQVGSDFARETNHFQMALNEILARGAEVF
jgi:predicted Zn finger-like uncharacterized protein